MRAFYVGLFYVAAAFAGIAMMAFLLIGITSPVTEGQLYFGAMALSAALGMFLLVGRAEEAETVFKIEKEVTMLRQELKALGEKLTSQQAAIESGLSSKLTADPDVVKCRLCGSQISKKIAKCPHCQTIQPTQEA